MDMKLSACAAYCWPSSRTTCARLNVLQLEFSDAPGGGAAFVLTLPLSVSPAMLLLADAKLRKQVKTSRRLAAFCAGLWRRKGG